MIPVSWKIRNRHLFGPAEALSYGLEKRTSIEECFLEGHLTRMVKNIKNKIWGDPVWSSVLAAGIVFIGGTAFAYFKGWMPVVQKWTLSSTYLPNWALVLLALFVIYNVIAGAVGIASKRSKLHGDIKKVIEDAANGSSSVTTLVRNARALALKLDDQEFAEWANKELSGSFENLSPEVLPKYRQVHGEPEALDMYGNWIPVRFGDEETERVLTYSPYGQDLITIEGLVTAMEGDSLIVSHSPQRKAAIDFLQRQGAQDYRLILGKSSAKRILDAVRHRVHEWALEHVNK